MLPRFIERTNEPGNSHSQSNNNNYPMKAINFNSISSPLLKPNEASKGQDEANCSRR